MTFRTTLPLLLLVAFCGCATYEKQPFTAVEYAKGNVYILDGVETLKTITVMRIGCGPPTGRATFPVKRKFAIYKYPDMNTVLTNIVQRSDYLDECVYDYFPDENTLVANYCDSPHAQIDNLK